MSSEGAECCGLILLCGFCCHCVDDACNCFPGFGTSSNSTNFESLAPIRKFLNIRSNDETHNEAYLADVQREAGLFEGAIVHSDKQPGPAASMNAAHRSEIAQRDDN
ncbi:hypothetical protein BJ165DRAFT_1588372 [Panaeolus papilionaceus]|nr:hypothetical protein BJ165DRAFT_1588372 [Panaeolus papilionaceus]